MSYTKIPRPSEFDDFSINGLVGVVQKADGTNVTITTIDNLVEWATIDELTAVSDIYTKITKPTI